MTGEELVTLLRDSILDDNVVPYLWETPELLRYLNESEVQACRRAHLIIDSTTENDCGTSATAGTGSTDGQRPLCILSVTQDQAVYNLSRKILQVKRCQVLPMSYPLVGPLSYPDLDYNLPDWFGTNGTIGTAGSGGYPFGFLNEPPNTITFVAAPGTDGTAHLVISRLPLIKFTLQTSPEIDEQYHSDLVYWAAHLAYLKNDADTFNMQLAEYYENKTIAKFGALPNAFGERMQKVLSQQQRMKARPFGS